MRPLSFLLLFILLLFEGCNNGDSNTQTSKPVTQEALAKKDSIHTAVTNKEKITGQSKPYAGQYCYIKKVYVQDGVNYIDADYVQFLMGEDAVNAAKKEGAAEVLDDYYILNKNTVIKKLPLAKDVSIQLVNTENGEIYLTETDYDSFSKRIKDEIFVLTIDNGIVKNIRMQFLP